MAAFKLKAVTQHGRHCAPSGYVMAMRADGKSTAHVFMTHAQFNEHNAEALALEQTEKRRQTLQDCEQFVKEHNEQKRREAEQKKAADRQRKLDAIAATKKRKALRASDKIVNDYLRSMKYAWRPVSVGQASVLQAPVTAPPAPVVPKLEEIATLADAERVARVAVERHAALTKQLAVMHVDLDAATVITRGPSMSMDRKNKLAL
ncbi:MAG: hypothetical protein ABUL62_19395 [Myxococcales bacterium]